MATFKAEMQHFQKGKKNMESHCHCTQDLGDWQVSEQTLDSVHKMLMVLSLHTLTLLPADSWNTAYIVRHSVLSRRMSPLTPQGADRWRLKESFV